MTEKDRSDEQVEVEGHVFRQPVEEVGEAERLPSGRNEHERRMLRNDEAGEDSDGEGRIRH